MSAEPARAYVGIGEVLDLLRPEFPDVTVSKIRFLETEGLIQPARSPSRYRKYTTADVERLRYILTAQRDQYLPLRVIKDQLDGRDEDAARPAGGNCWPPPGWTRPGWPNSRTSGWSGGPGGTTARRRWPQPGPWWSWTGTVSRPATCGWYGPRWNGRPR